jgi:hypothetical protein
MIEAASTSETLVHFYQTTQRNNPEDTHFQFKVCLLDMTDVVPARSTSASELKSKEQQTALICLTLAY